MKPIQKSRPVEIDSYGQLNCVEGSQPMFNCMNSQESCGRLKVLHLN